jgi:hypothetical protein
MNRPFQSEKIYGGSYASYVEQNAMTSSGPTLYASTKSLLEKRAPRSALCIWSIEMRNPFSFGSARLMKEAIMCSKKLMRNLAHFAKVVIGLYVGSIAS